MIFNTENFANTQKMIIFAASNLNKHYIMELEDLTEKEKDLIANIRNYRRAYPNGKRNLEIAILDLVYELMDEREDCFYI